MMGAAMLKRHRCAVSLGGGRNVYAGESGAALVPCSSSIATMYSELVSRKTAIIEQVEKWEMYLERELNLQEVQSWFTSLYTITNSAKLRSFQYCILHQILVLNEYVFQRRGRN